MTGPSYDEVEAFLNAQDAARPRRREHHLPSELYRSTEHAFCVTLCARQHGEPFRNVALAQGVIEALEHRRRAGVWRVYAYCLMPDHLHAVVQLIGPYPEAPAPKGLLQVLGEFRSYTTRRAWTHGLHGRLWQHDQFDTLLNRDREFVARCRYLLENPVRKGWVDDWTAWPFGGIPDEW